LTEAHKALNLDPVSPYMSQSLARNLRFARRFQDAIAQYKTAIALEPNYGMTHHGLGLAYLETKQYAKALDELQIAMQQQNGDPMVTGALAYGYAVSGNAPEARKMLGSMLHQSRSISPLVISHIYIGLGDKDQAFEWLRKAIDDRAVDLMLESDPIYDPLRSDPRFADALRRMKLDAAAVNGSGAF